MKVTKGGDVTSLIGKEVFLRDGRCARVLAELPGQYIVEMAYRSSEEDDEPRRWFGEISRESDVFLEAPVAEYSAQVAELEEKADGLRHALTEITTKKADAEKELATRLKYLDQFAGLERVEQFLRGEITHYVLESEHDVRILTFDDARDRSDYTGKIWNGRTYEMPLRMLQLFGHPQYRTVGWELSDHSYGSRTSYACHPYTSEAPARAKAKELLDAKVAALLAKEGYMHGGNYLIECAKNLALVLPDVFIARWKEHEAQSLAQSIATKQKELAELLAKQVAA